MPMRTMTLPPRPGPDVVDDLVILPGASFARIGRGIAMRAIRIVGALAVTGLVGCAGDQSPVPGQPSFYRSLAEAGAVLDAPAAAAMISNYRQNNGLNTVVLDPSLTELAQEQAQVMAARNKIDPDVVGPFRSRIARSGFDTKVAAENISAGYQTIAEAFSGWRESPHHRANMLLKGATHMGIAAVYAPGTKYRVFWALILAAPDGKRG